VSVFQQSHHVVVALLTGRVVAAELLELHLLLVLQLVLLLVVL